MGMTRPIDIWGERILPFRQTAVELIVPGGDIDIVPGVIRPGVEQLAVEVAGAGLVGGQVQDDAPPTRALINRSSRRIAASRDRELHPRE
jgi:hypothetical protein